MSSHRYPHTLTGFTQTPLTNDWAHTDTQHFLMGPHRHPSLIIGLIQIPTLSHGGSHRHPSLITRLTQIPTLFHGSHTDTPHQRLGLHRYPHFLMMSHGVHTDTPHYCLGSHRYPTPSHWAHRHPSSMGLSKK